ncbi:MAG: hypothetical protein ACJA0N_001405 [Pseudohongiellaceae bacterium]|jgi:hypothetical protein
MSSYFGAPVNWPNGSAFGTLCGLKPQAVQFTEHKISLIKQFASVDEILLLQVTNHNELHMLVEYDNLTDTPSRRALLKKVQHEFDRYQRYHPPFTVIYLDVDHFKLINNSFGHNTGDQVLAELSGNIINSQRQTDFGGIGKEYAVDKTLQLLTQIANIPLLVNYGGDINCNTYAKDYPWRIGVEKSPLSSQTPDLIALKQGGLATSGSTHRYIVHQGKRYSHVLNPKTGWPVENPPLSITVAAANCTQVGMLATFAMLQGKGAEDFLK